MTRPNPHPTRHTFAFAAIAGLMLLALAMPAHAVTVPPSTMPKWEVKDIVLCAQTNYPDWQAYQVVRVTARFDGPNATTLFVNGFWDGKNVAGCPATAHAFRVRFTPHIQGTWFFQISNNMNDAGLTVTPAEAGAITVNNPAPGPAGKTPLGFLRRDNPAGVPNASYIWGTGDHAFLWGQTYYQIINKEVAGLTSVWRDAVDRSTAGGMNNYTMSKIRLLIAPWNPNGGADTQPYKQTANVINRDQLNVPHWQALDRIVKYLYERNVVAEIVIFRDTGDEEIVGTPTQDCRYLRYATSRYAAYPNVIWSLSNEWENTARPASYWNDLGNAVRGLPQSTCTGSDFSTPLDPWFTSANKHRILTIHPAAIDPDNGAFQFCFEFAGSQWPTAASLQSHKRQNDVANPPYHGDRRGYESIACNQNIGGSPVCLLPSSPIPVSNDEYGYFGIAQQTQTEHRNMIWGIATGGGYGTAGDARPIGTDTQGPIQTTKWAGAAEYDDIKRLVSFFTSTTKGIEYWKMSPQTSCQANTRVHTLAEPGKQYVVYTADGLQFVIANFVTGNYQRTWYDPRNADANNPAAGIVTACANLTTNSFTPPAGSPGDWVLLLKKTPTCQ